MKHFNSNKNEYLRNYKNYDPDKVVTKKYGKKDGHKKMLIRRKIEEIQERKISIDILLV